jgi:hypothetical protein
MIWNESRKNTIGQKIEKEVDTKVKQEEQMKNPGASLASVACLRV